ncbi:MAG: tRNA (adenosine(37)-N6)-dimethylallyltransferase MiaA [Anaerolineaceae bacterium]|nr:tRNA (adenosine(37)-N6)-dimethylallyltransferase MiaA [Anaerolineaceae bacterium]
MVVILGPTAVGKTKLAVETARALNGEIISADSRLFYRGMDIGTAKPTLTERQGIPHHLIDVVDPDETLSLAVFQREVAGLCDQIHARGRLPMLVGGTGQYVMAVVEGWQTPRVSQSPELRAALQTWADEIGGDALLARLAGIDPSAAANIDPRNIRRTIRALEVIFVTGRRFSDQRRKSEPSDDMVLIGLTRPRAELFTRIDQRIEQMIADGLVDEVKGLLARGYGAHLPSMSAIGYHEIGQYVTGQVGLDEAIILMKRRTRQFVRRQANWFKAADPRIQWFTVNDCTADELIDYIEKRKLNG